MLRLLTTLLLLAPAAGAQAFVRSPALDLDEPVHVAPPAEFVTLAQVDSLGDAELYVLAVRDADGALTVIADSLYRQPGVAAPRPSARWQQATMGCGTACFVTWYLDPEDGAVSPGIGSPIYEDEARGWVLAPSADGVQIVDPFDPTWAWTLTIPESSPLSHAVLSLWADVTVSSRGVLQISADGVPGTIRARVPKR